MRDSVSGQGGQIQLTQANIIAWLRSLYTRLAVAQADLAKARDAEVDAKHEYDRARRAAMLGEKPHRVARGAWTTAERDAWVDDQAEDERFAYDKAVVVREAAADHLRVVRDQAEIVRSLGATVRLAYDMAGTAEE